MLRGRRRKRRGAGAERRARHIFLGHRLAYQPLNRPGQRRRL